MHKIEPQRAEVVEARDVYARQCMMRNLHGQRGTKYCCGQLEPLMDALTEGVQALYMSACERYRTSFDRRAELALMMVAMPCTRGSWMTVPFTEICVSVSWTIIQLSTIVGVSILAAQPDVTQHVHVTLRLLPTFSSLPSSLKPQHSGGYQKTHPYLQPGRLQKHD
jgi:hypothetical protein